MARKNREISKSGVYHVILRGNNKQSIFEDTEDRLYFLNKLFYYRRKFNFKVYAYCLMDNHVHLLIKDGQIGVSDIIKRLAGTYAYWFNRKYDRIGHLYQERFKSEVVETDRYFLTVVRYIHNNPVKAGIVKDCAQYIWSSYNDYLKAESNIDTDLCMSMLGKKGFIEFHRKNNCDECLEMKDTIFRFMPDSKALKIIKSIVPDEIVGRLTQIDKRIRNKYLGILRQQGLSIKQICRLTGVSEGIIRRQKLV